MLFKVTKSEPWYANIVNFMVVGYVPPRENKRMNHTSSESALMTYLEDVYQWKKASRSSNDATHHHMEDIMVDSALIQRFGKVDSSGQPRMKTQRTLSEGVERVRVMGILIQEISCHSPPTSRLSSSMSRELITWDLFQSQNTVNISWW